LYIPSLLAAWSNGFEVLTRRQIQELNYKITVTLNSDARSEVEGLRWVLTRRAAITVGVSAFMLFVALRYTSYVQHLQQEERRRQPPRREPPTPHAPEEYNAATQTHFDSVVGRQEALGGELLAGEGVSLG
jgi:cytochrome c-type biogenesis protein CcmH/NrfG